MISRRYFRVMRKDMEGKARETYREGWFLFGVIPLYLRDL